MKQLFIQFSLFPQNAMRFWQCSRGSSKVALASISLFVLVKVVKVELVEVALGAVISSSGFIATCLLWANLHIDLYIYIYSVAEAVRKRTSLSPFRHFSK